jgi:hypothetical protein
MSDASQICHELGFTPDEAADAAERVQSKKSLIDNRQKIQTSLELPDGNTVHLHQLVRDKTSDGDFLVTELQDQKIKLMDVEMHFRDEESEMYFGAEYWFTLGDFIGHAEPCESVDGEPIWGY